MKLKIGAIPDRTPIKLPLSLSSDLHDALQDCASIHAKEFGQNAQVFDLEALMIERFLASDAQFKRARKLLRKSTSWRSRPTCESRLDSRGRAPVRPTWIGGLRRPYADPLRRS